MAFGLFIQKPQAGEDAPRLCMLMHSLRRAGRCLLLARRCRLRRLAAGLKTGDECVLVR